SCSRSAISEITPSADDCQIVWPSTPVNTKVRRLNPPACPKPAWSVVPRMPMKISGKARSDSSRARSRISLMKSRWAIARTAESSCIGLLRGVGPVDDLEVGVLQRRGMRPDDAQGRLDRPQDFVRPARFQRHLERAAARVGDATARELGIQTRTVVRVD